MMQAQILASSWPNFNLQHSNHSIPYNQETGFFEIEANDFSSSFSSPQESSAISSNSYDPRGMFDMFDEVFDLQNFGGVQIISPPMEGLENMSSGEIEEICEWINEDGEGNLTSLMTMRGEEWSPCVSLESSENSVVFPLKDMSLVLPRDGMELDDQLCLLHLLRAYGEAMENGEKDLAEVIVKSINEKSLAMGNTTERVAFRLFQSKENESEYLRQESIKNLITAFKVFYQSLPYGRFAHSAANSAILEAMSNDAPIIHIVDFDIGEGIQWPPMIEALTRKQKTLRITSIKSEDECSSSYWDFEETKKRLQNHARECGLKLQIEEKSIEDLASELTRMKKKRQGREWLVFNCMVGLPHMARRRSRIHVLEFLKIAKELLANFAGIMTLGDGEEEYSTNTCSSYKLFFDKRLRHYQALFESLERNFPTYLAEARTAMESLFLAPFMCGLNWFRDWEDMVKNYNLREATRLTGRKFSQECLAEAKEMVNERENSFKVKIEGYREHEMVLEWKDTPLVRVSTWM